MAPRMDVLNQENKAVAATTAVVDEPLSTNIRRAPSQAESVAAQVEADRRSNNNGNDDNDDDPPPSTPPPSIPKQAPPVRKESALKRLGRSLRRRSLSAPPSLNRRSLLEEHFRVETEQHTHKVVAVLPGVPKHEDNWSRDMHDFFNLIVLVPVVALNTMNWDWSKLLQANPENIPSLGEAWTGDYYYEFFYVTILYFIADLVWIAAVPDCVRSPSVIIQHHLATLLYIMVPHSVPPVRWCMGACMSVEINTWLLIARRVFNKQGFPPWIVDLSFVSIRIKLISVLFYVTWIAIRCVLYPYMLIPIWQLYMWYSGERESYWNIILVCFPMHAVFCALNLKWSYDLLMSKIRYWKRRGVYSAEEAEKEKGL